ncbi:MAG: homoserine dehydrogenase [Clostridia bacterium]|nr:homoserine dehydrogenase [Clostridia bacterium]
MQIAVSLFGFGNVGREFVRILADRSGELAMRYGIEPQVVSIVASHGGVAAPNGMSASELLERARGPRVLAEQPGFIGGDPEDLDIWLPAQASGVPMVLVDATWSDLSTGEPGLSRLLGAARRGCHLITLNKAPLVVDFDGLKRTAREYDVLLKFSGATAAGLPTIDTVKVSLAGAEILSIEGVLNSTTNYVLTAMSDEGLSYEDALRRAQAMGLAETDPGRDVQGVDTACKMLVLANAAMGAHKKLGDVRVSGIDNISRRDIAAWSVEGRTVKLVGRAVRTEDGVSIDVKPTPLPYRDFLAQVTGDAKGIRFRTDLFGELVMMGGSGGLTAAAGSALRDLVNLGRELQLRRNAI